MNDKSCNNCDSCIQYFTVDSYPEFGCDKENSIRLDGMCFPSKEQACGQWGFITTDKWKLR